MFAFTSPNRGYFFSECTHCFGGFRAPLWGVAGEAATVGATVAAKVRRAGAATRMQMRIILNSSTKEKGAKPLQPSAQGSEYFAIPESIARLLSLHATEPCLDARLDEVCEGKFGVV